VKSDEKLYIVVLSTTNINFHEPIEKGAYSLTDTVGILLTKRQKPLIKAYKQGLLERTHFCIDSILFEFGYVLVTLAKFQHFSLITFSLFIILKTVFLRHQILISVCYASDLQLFHEIFCVHIDVMFL